MKRLDCLVINRAGSGGWSGERQRKERGVGEGRVRRGERSSSRERTAGPSVGDLSPRQINRIRKRDQSLNQNGRLGIGAGSESWLLGVATLSLGHQESDWGFPLPSRTDIARLSYGVDPAPRSIHTASFVILGLEALERSAY